MPATTYPGTVTPIRGLAPFTESERDVLFGRDAERDELARLITGDGFRAGLLYGESGVGKTSLLRAGLIPHLRDHGVIALPCDDLRDPAGSFARAAHTVTGLQATEGEPPLGYLARIVSQALAGQQYVFILDDVELVLRAGEASVINELGELFSRVVTRSGGRARFLFCCTSDQVHRFGVLERRTGSLFPPLSRFELLPLSTAAATQILERTLALAGSSADRPVAQAVAQGLGQRGPILPADLQLAVLALGELGITTTDDLVRAGGPHELERAWLRSIAAAAGNERAALRLLAELATGDGDAAFTPEWAATRAGVDRGFAEQAFPALADKGVIVEVPSSTEADTTYQLAHPVLAERVREQAAPARANARRVYELIGSKATQGKRLTAREWLEVWRENIAPATPAEAAVLQRTKRFFLTAAAAAAAAPILVLFIVYVALAGQYYLDAHGEDERIVVRKGRPALAAFHWLPASPGFGNVLADTGVTRAMVAAPAWQAVLDHDASGSLEGDSYAAAVEAALSPERRALLDYARTGDESALDVLFAPDAAPAERAARLAALEPIARGGSREAMLIEQALADESPAVQATALAVAAAAARRRDAAYADVLAGALRSDDAQLRRLAFSAVRGLDPDHAARLFQLALTGDPGAAARAELLTVVTTDAGGDAPTAASAVSILANGDIAPANRRRAERILRRAFATDPATASTAAVELVSDHRAPEDHRLLAIELLEENAPEEVYAVIAPAMKLAIQGSSEAVRAAAWPMFARTNPNEAARELVGLAEMPESMRTAAALAWGELARTNEPAARPALEPFLSDPSPEVRAAAARAFGFVGRAAQADLVKLVKEERFDVAEGAAYGLANTILVGGPASPAVAGVRQLWKKKGRAKRVAAEVFARIARTKASSVSSYLSQASRDNDDTDLRLIGVRGLCNGVASGHRGSGRALRRAADDASTDVRRAVAECAVAHVAAEPEVASDIAAALTDDIDPGIRADAARVLARVAAEEKGRTASSAARALVRFASDDDREVRLIAARGLRELGGAAPDDTKQALQQAFERRDADEGEKLELLRAARAVGAGALVPIALSDPAPAVRVAAIDAAMGSNADVGAALNAALADRDPSVRREALVRVAESADGLDAAAVSSALALAIRDPDPAIATVALTTLAAVSAVDAVVARLEAELRSPSEHVRARAAHATRGLLGRSPEAAIAILEPLLDDPSRDVRAAALAPLALALAATRDPAALAALLVGSERHATRRLVAAGALFAAGARAELERIASDAPPLARRLAALALGLSESNADGLTFLSTLVR